MPIYETKKVVIDENDNIINVGELEEMQPNWRVIEMEMKYTPEHGWRPVDWRPPASTEDFLLDLDYRISCIELGVKQLTTYTLCKTVIQKKTYGNKENMMIKLDVFLLNNRITQDEYSELLDLLEQKESA